MEKLIEFLLSHIYLVFVVGGILFTMLRKSPIEKPPKPGNPGASGRSPDSMPDFGGGGNRLPKRMEVERRAPTLSEQEGRPSSVPVRQAGRPARVGAPTMRQPSPSNAQEVYRSPGQVPTVVRWDGEGTSGGEGIPSVSAALSAREDEAYHHERAAQAVASSLSAKSTSNAPLTVRKTNSSVRLKRDELTRAVVWAEILGPPRSRKPYGR